MILFIHVTMQVCLNIRLSHDKFKLFLRHLLFYGVSLLTVNQIRVGLELVIVLQLFSCCLLQRFKHFLITVDLRQMAPSGIHSCSVGSWNSKTSSS